MNGRKTKRTAALKRARPVAAAFGLVALLGVVPANAADVIMEEAPAAPAVPMEEAPVASWAGAYAGLQLGYGFAGHTQTDGAGGVSGQDVHTDGIVGGAFAGIQGQTANIVYGVEADIGYSGIEGKDDGVRSEGGVEGSLRARLGYSITPDVLIYGTAGGAAEKLEVSQGGNTDDKALLGYTVGAGTDVKITENVFGRIEYRYTDFGSREFDLGSGSQDVDASNHRVMFGVGMGF